MYRLSMNGNLHRIRDVSLPNPSLFAPVTESVSSQTCSPHPTSIPLTDMQWRRKVPKSVCVGGGGGGAHRHIIYVPSVNNQYKQVVFGYMVIYVTTICVSILKLSTRQLIGIWKMPNNYLSVLYKHSSRK